MDGRLQATFFLKHAQGKTNATKCNNAPLEIKTSKSFNVLVENKELQTPVS